MNPTLATPVLATSKPAMQYQDYAVPPEYRENLHPPPPPLVEGAKSSRRSLASLAFSCPNKCKKGAVMVKICLYPPKW